MPASVHPTAFTEAVAGAVSLSVLSPANLKDHGLLPVPEADLDGMYDINFLYRRALQYVSLRPLSKRRARPAGRSQSP